MDGLLILGVYFAAVMLITVFISRKGADREEFLVGRRNMGIVSSAFSIAATWIWAPALLVSAERAYTTGLAGFFWFLIPNVLTLIAFIPFAKRIREQMPHGVTLSGYMRNVYSTRAANVYLVQLTLIAVLSTTVQLLAGGKIMHEVVPEIPFAVFVVLLGLIALSYSWIGGIRASIVTDAVQMLFMIGAAIYFVPAILRHTGAGAVADGLGGFSGEFRSLFDSNGIRVFLEFGLATTIGLAAGPFGDQVFWQRAFAVRRDGIVKAFLLGALSFAIVPLSMGLLGFAAAGSGFVPDDVSIVNLELILHYLPAWVIWPFTFMLISGLLSTADSNLSAISSLAEDVFGRFDLSISRWSMVGLVVLASALAMVPELTILKLFLVYGIVRASTLLVTILTLLRVRLDEAGVVWGVIASLTVGLPIFAYGTLAGNNVMQIIGSILGVSLSGIVALAVTRWKAYAHRAQADFR